MSRRREGAARDIDQESRSGAGQDLMKRVSKHEALNFLRDFLALYSQRRQLLRQARQHDAGSLGAQDHDRLLRERLDDLGGPSLSHARCKFGEPIGQLLLAEGGELRRRRMSLEQIEHGRVIQMRPNNALQRGMDLRQQAADAVTRLCNLARQILIKAAQHCQLCDMAVGKLQRTQRMRHAARGLGNDVSVSRVGLCFTGVQVGDAPHRQTRHVRYPNAFRSSNRNRKSSDRGGLIHDKQDLAMFFELSHLRRHRRRLRHCHAAQYQSWLLLRFTNDGPANHGN